MTVLLVLMLRYREGVAVSYEDELGERFDYAETGEGRFIAAREIVDYLQQYGGYVPCGGYNEDLDFWREQ